LFEDWDEGRTPKRFKSTTSFGKCCSSATGVLRKNQEMY
jgi:hypothetical protein